MRSLLAAALLCLTGCSYTSNGVVHHVIVGFGVVSSPKTNAVAQVTKINALGFYYGGSKVIAGYLASTMTEVSLSATNILLEIK